MRIASTFVRVIAISAGKGGVGKTTLASNLGVVLTKLGFKVCIVDANFTAPDLATHFGLNPEYSVWDVLKGKDKIENAVYEHDCGLHIIPGGSEVKTYSKDIYQRLKRKMRRMKYDFIILDTPPGLGDDAKAALTPAKEVIIVANPEWTSLNNAYRMYLAAQSMNKKIVGIVINRSLVHEYEPSTDLVNKFTGVNVLGEIPEDVLVRKSIAIQNPVVISYPESRAAEEMWKIGALLGGIDYKPRKKWIDRILRFFGF
jgi:flagellar biosynthesis protein FlhG